MDPCLVPAGSCDRIVDSWRRSPLPNAGPDKSLMSRRARAGCPALWMLTAREQARRLTHAETSARAITITTDEAFQMSAWTGGNIVSNPQTHCSGRLLPRQNSARKLTVGKRSDKAGGASGATIITGAAAAGACGSGRITAAGASRSTYAEVRAWEGPAQEGPAWQPDPWPRKTRLGGRV